MHPRASELIELLDLKPHPEGGFFREVFRSPLRVHPNDARGERAAITTIYFLLVDGGHSRWHRVSSDEIWHHYEGDALELFWIDETKTRCNQYLLGSVGEGRSPVQVVPAGCWQAARTTGAYTLVGCTVGPGFEYEDFTLLLERPDEEAEIRRRFPELGVFV
jgi:hypothetical protein